MWGRTYRHTGIPAPKAPGPGFATKQSQRVPLSFFPKMTAPQFSSASQASSAALMVGRGVLHKATKSGSTCTGVTL